MSTDTFQPIEHVAVALNDPHRVHLEHAFDALQWLDSQGVKVAAKNFVGGSWTIHLAFDDFKRLFSGRSAPWKIVQGRKHYSLKHDGIEYYSSTECIPEVLSEVL